MIAGHLASHDALGILFIQERAVQGTSLPSAEHQTCEPAYGSCGSSKTGSRILDGHWL
jgi:hypothetical protein